MAKIGGGLLLADALKLKIKESMSPISGGDIDKLMKENLNFVLVTDKISDYDLLLREVPHPDRMIVEVFSPRDYLRALRAGVKYPAYCVWTPAHLKTAKEFGFPIVTMYANNFFRQQETIRMVQDLHDSGVTILLFWTGYPDRDKPEWLKKYLGRTVSKIYTDKWAPAHKPE